MGTWREGRPNRTAYAPRADEEIDLLFPTEEISARRAGRELSTATIAVNFRPGEFLEASEKLVLLALGL